MDDIKVADEKPLLKTEASEMVKEEDKEPHKVEERSKVLKAEETKDFCKIEEDSKPPKAEQSEEHPKVEEDQASPKVEMCLKTDNSALKLEEGPGSLKLEQSEKCFQKVNQDALKIEEGKDTLPKLENSHGFDPSLEVKCEEKPLKPEVKSDELMDIDGSSVGQMNPKPLLTSDVEDMGRDLLATPLPDDGDAEMDAFVRDSASVAAPPSDFDAGRDVRMTTPDAEDSATESDEVAARTTNAVGGKIAAPQQVVVKAEPVEMELDSVLNSIEETRAQPQKRRRILMDAVVVPFDRAARAHADAERQERTEANRQALDQRFAQMQNPKVKKAKNAPVLSLDTVIARLSAQNIPFEPYPIDLEPDIRDVTVRRDFMTQEYGGNSQETFPTIAEKFWRKTGMRYFMYLNLNFNPRCPEIPGAPGLIFSADCAPETDIVLSDSESEGEDEVKVAETSKNTKKKVQKANDADEDEKEDTKPEYEDDGTDILFARLSSGVWQYQGQYVQAKAPNLTIGEWKEQPANVRQTWAEQLAIKRWGLWIRADIAFRRELGRKPTLAEKNAALEDGTNKFLTVTPAEISAAFDCGQAVIIVSTLKCVGYNTAFQRALAAKMPLFVPKPRKDRKAKKVASKPKGKPAAKASSTKRGVASASKGKKRAREELESEDDAADDSDVEPGLEVDDESPEENVYQPRGTRSRPIVLP